MYTAQTPGLFNKYIPARLIMLVSEHHKPVHVIWPERLAVAATVQPTLTLTMQVRDW